MEEKQTAEGKGSEGVEKVLIERDGKFELVNASDMEAVAGLPTEEGVGEAEAEGGGGGGGGGQDDPGGELPNPPGDQTDTSVAEDESTPFASEPAERAGADDQPSDPTGVGDPPQSQSADKPPVQQSDVPTTPSGSHHDEPCPPQDTSSRTAKPKEDETSRGAQTKTHTPKQSTSRSGSLKSGSRVQIVVADHIHTKTYKGLSSASTATLGQSSVAARRKQMQMSRVVSAPSTRRREKLDEEDAKLKRERSEAAFAAWLATKNSEIIKRRKSEKGKLQMSEEELKQKRQRNEAAYQGWLANKNRDHKSQERASVSPVPASVDRLTEDNSAAFDGWVSRKRLQRKREMDLEEKRKAEEEEAAGKVAPDIVDKAYKEWVHKKNLHAREEAQKKEQYRRSYFSQSKRLRQSLTLRFEGF